MKKLIIALGAFALTVTSAGAQVVLPRVKDASGASVSSGAAVATDSSGADATDTTNHAFRVTVVAGSSTSAATSTALTGTVSDTSAHVFGPFTPQLARGIWVTLNATVSATGTAQLLRSTDAGATKLALTAGGAAWGNFSLVTNTGVRVNEPLVEETDAAATYYLAVTLTAGTITYRVSQ